MALARRALGGTRHGVDVLTRSHVILLEALAMLTPDERGAIELHLAGVMSTADLDALDPRLVHVHGYLAHDRSIELMRSADLLFLPMHDLPTGMRAGIVPGKTYEYLGSGRPILAAVPEGDARDLLDEAGNALLCRPGDVQGMVELLREALRRFRAGTLQQAPDAGVVARYERRVLTRQLADLFDRTLGSPNDDLPRHAGHGRLLGVLA
jgi:glycosyltransferase involved in cell wall biosynthesis